MPKIKSSFYKEFEQRKEIESKQEEIRNIYNLGNDKPIIIDTFGTKSFKLLHYMLDLVVAISKVAIYLLVTILSSIGLTAVLNAPIRGQILKIIFR